MKYTFSKETKTFKIFTALKAGDKLTQAEASKRFGVSKTTVSNSKPIRSRGGI